MQAGIREYDGVGKGQRDWGFVINCYFQTEHQLALSVRLKDGGGNGVGGITACMWGDIIQTQFLNNSHISCFIGSNRASSTYSQLEYALYVNELISK